MPVHKRTHLSERKGVLIVIAIAAVLVGAFVAYDHRLPPRPTAIPLGKNSGGCPPGYRVAEGFSGKFCCADGMVCGE